AGSPGAAFTFIKAAPGANANVAPAPATSTMNSRLVSPAPKPSPSDRCEGAAGACGGSLDESISGQSIAAACRSGRIKETRDIRGLIDVPRAPGPGNDMNIGGVRSQQGARSLISLQLKERGEKAARKICGGAGHVVVA